MKSKLLLSIILILPILLFSQIENTADALFEAKKYDQARKLYENALKAKATTPKQKTAECLNYFQLARCCFELKDFDGAIGNFELAGNRFSLRDKYLGEIYFDRYRFEESALAYQNYLLTLKLDDPLLASFQLKAKKSEIAAGLIKKVNDIAIVDSLVVNKSNFLNFFTFSKELGTLNQIPLQINSQKTADKITYTTQRGDRICFSDTLHGQFDIFTSYKLIDNWTKADTISNNINTSANENYPFFLLDGKTLYFSSDGENSMGGYDLFLTRYLPMSNKYLAPENIGMPFNSPFNDYMMVIDEQQKLGWFVSDRYQPEGKVIIYTFVPNDSKVILHTEDKESLRSLASLKSYRKSGKSAENSTVLHNEQSVKNDSQIEFIVNDSTVYRSIKRFKSDDSFRKWTEYKNAILSFEKGTKDLNDLRSKYENTDQKEIRTELTLKIIALEKQSKENEMLVKAKELALRNFENEILNTRSK